MPATVVLFGPGAPEVAVVDSSFLFQALIDPLQQDTRHDACRGFAEQLRSSGSVLIVSPLLYLEAPACWRRLFNRGALVPSRPGLDESVSRQAAYEEATDLLRAFMDSFETYDVRFTPRLMAAATSIAGQYNLNSHDALHVAVARSTGVSDLITVDTDFRRVDGLTVWCPP